MPGWAKAAVYIAVPVGIIVGAYFIIINFLFGPLNALKDVYKTQLKTLVDKVDGMINDHGTLTSDDWKLINIEKQQMDSTLSAMIQIANTFQWLAGFVVVTLGAVLFAKFGLKPLAEAWKNRAQGVAATGNGACYAGMCAIGDAYAQVGNIGLASSLRAALDLQWTSTDLDYMASQLVYYQSLLTQVQGWELIYAQFMVYYLPLEIAAIPTWIAVLPPPP